MKSMWALSAAIFFMTYFYRTGGGHGHLPPPPGSATAISTVEILELIFIFVAGIDTGLAIYNRYHSDAPQNVGYAAHFGGALCGTVQLSFFSGVFSFKSLLKLIQKNGHCYQTLFIKE